jgi:hypothetical protein
MPHPKEKIAQQHEKELIAWLKFNQNSLPLSLYALAKRVGWSFGALRGTILRITARPEAENPLIVQDISNPDHKRYISYVALKGTASERRLHDERAYIEEQTGKKASNALDSKFSTQIVTFLKKLQELDEKVLRLASEISDPATIDKFLEYEFGLDKNEKKTLVDLIQTLEAMQK